MYKLLDWIPEEIFTNSKYYSTLALNHHPEAINYLQKHLNDIDKLIYEKHEIWKNISSNPYAYELLMNNKKKINFNELCRNKNPMILHILTTKKKYYEQICWMHLSANSSEYAVNILINNQENISWKFLCHNKNTKAVKLLYYNIHKIDWYEFSANKNPLAIKLIKDNFHKIHNLLDFKTLSMNMSAMQLLKVYPEIIDWGFIIENENAHDIIIKNMDKIYSENNRILSDMAFNNNKKVLQLLIDYNILNKNNNNFNLIMFNLCKNPNAIDIIKKYPTHINYKYLNINPNTIKLIENNLKLGIINIDDINWYNVLKSPHIFKCDYDKMKQKLWYETHIARSIYDNRFNPKYKYKWKNDWKHDI